jgi:hypothetical protein
MPVELPIACSLSAPEFARREAEIAELGRAALLATRQNGAHAELRFAPADGLRERVEQFVAAESACCPFLAMRIADEPDAVVLTIDAPADAELVLGELLAAFKSAPEEIR